MTNTSRDFAKRELAYHQRRGHQIKYYEGEGFMCLKCGVGCAGVDVGDLREFANTYSVINGSKYPTAPEYTFPE